MDELKSYILEERCKVDVPDKRRAARVRKKLVGLHRIRIPCDTADSDRLQYTTDENEIHVIVIVGYVCTVA